MTRETALSWFKFEPTGYMFGKIQKRSKEAKVIFMELLCKYWTNRCNYSVEDAKLDFGDAEITELIQHRVCKDENGRLRIKFLDEQLEEINHTRKQNSANGKKSAAVRRAKSTKLNGRSTTPQRNSTEETRVDENREDILKGDLIEIFFKDLPNSSELERIARINHVTPEVLRQKIPEFRKAADLEYPTFQLFTRHFKNWYQKVGSKPPPGQDQPTKTTVTFGKKNGSQR